MRRAIYTEAHTATWLDIALTLRAELGIEARYWVGKAPFERTVAEQFPDAIFHARTDAVRGIPASRFADVPLRPLDVPVLHQFSQVMLAAGKMMDRLDVADGFRAEERMRLFHVQLRYWRGVIEYVQPDIVLFPVQPHTGYDYVLYELCKAYGIPTTMFQWTLFHDWIYPLDDIVTGYAEIRQRYHAHLASGERVDLSEEVERYLQQVTGDYRGAIPDYLLKDMPDDVRGALLGAVPGGDTSALAEEIAVVQKVAAPPSFPSPWLFFRDYRRARKYLARYLQDRAHRRRRARRQARAAGTRLVDRARRTLTSKERSRMRRSLERALDRQMRQLARAPSRAGKGTRSLWRATQTGTTRFGRTLSRQLRKLARTPRRMKKGSRRLWRVVRQMEVGSPGTELEFAL